MKRIPLLIFSLSISAAAVFSCSDAANVVRMAASGQVEASGPAVRQTRTLTSDINTLKVESGIDVQYIQGSSAKIVVEAPENIFDIIATTVQGSTLTVRPTKGFSTKRGQTVRVIVTAPAVSNFAATSGASLSVDPGYKMADNVVYTDASHGASLSIASLAAGSVNVRCSSGASTAISKIAVNALDASASSGASLSLSGHTSTATLKAGGGASLSASGLSASSGLASATGGASVSSNIRNAQTHSSGGGSVKNR